MELISTNILMNVKDEMFFSQKYIVFIFVIFIG